MALIRDSASGSALRVRGWSEEDIQFLRKILTRTHQFPTSCSPAQLQNHHSVERLYAPSAPTTGHPGFPRNDGVTIKASPTSRCKALKIITKHQNKNASDRHVASIQVVSADEPRQLLQREPRLVDRQNRSFAVVRNRRLESTSSALSHNKPSGLSALVNKHTVFPPL